MLRKLTDHSAAELHPTTPQPQVGSLCWEQIIAYCDAILCSWWTT